MKKMLKGISVLNPVDIERGYLSFTVDYAIKHGYDHFQFIGPIHDPVKGNIDGMTFSVKYSEFNSERNSEYIKYCTDVVNEALVKLSGAGIKTYMWHHELDLPSGFGKAYPEVLNSDGDVEVTHPRVKDYLENRIADFFAAYPCMDGIILTLHETKVPLLKLKNQKLGKIERVKYVTEILYNKCLELGKELVVRPFASLEEDYRMMMDAYESISKELLVMDKWTQFDWSLTLPHNKFFAKIKNNPLLVETDIFGEYFGKGRLPLMLKSHIAEKFDYCEGFSPVGYVNRIDRNGRDPFGEVNEVNLEIMEAYMDGRDPEPAIDRFFLDMYGDAGAEVRRLMEDTEDIQKHILYIKNYYYSELSLFPLLTHCKNHFYFEMMKKDCEIVSEEWYIPSGWERGSLDSVLLEKEDASRRTGELLSGVIALKGRISEDKYENLYKKFKNLDLIAKIWTELTHTFYTYVKYFETLDDEFEAEFFDRTERLIELNEEGKSALGSDFYCVGEESFKGGGVYEYISVFVGEVRESFKIEKKETKRLSSAGLYDFLIAGGAMEGHKLKKEVNFSAALITDGKICRIPGNKMGASWSTINAHGWFSYEIALREGCENTVRVTLSSSTDRLCLKVTLGEQVHIIDEPIADKAELTFKYNAGVGETNARIRFDKISANVPMVYTVEVL